MNVLEPISHGEIKSDLSFVSHRNCKDYILETESAIFLPAGYNEGFEVEVNFNHPLELAIIFEKDIYDIETKQSKEWYLQNVK
jgi:hypothetical protein